jgi:hypothetical protein
MIKRLALLPLTAALLSACGGGDLGSSPVPVSTAPTAIQGTLTGYSGGASTIEVLAIDTAPKSASNPALASASLSASGSFTLPLPTAAAITPYLSAPGTAADGLNTETGCDGAITDSAPEAQSYSFGTLTANGQSYSSVSSSSNTATRTFTLDGTLWIYTSKATTLGGSLSCPPETQNGVTATARISANATLTPGWNVLKLHADSVVGADGTSVTTTVSFSTATDGNRATSWTSASASPLSVDPLAGALTARLNSFRFGPLHF